MAIIIPATIVSKMLQSILSVVRCGFHSSSDPFPSLVLHIYKYFMLHLSKILFSQNLCRCTAPNFQISYSFIRHIVVGAFIKYIQHSHNNVIFYFISFICSIFICIWCRTISFGYVFGNLNKALHSSVSCAMCIHILWNMTGISQYLCVNVFSNNFI